RRRAVDPQRAADLGNLLSIGGWLEGDAKLAGRCTVRRQAETVVFDEAVREQDVESRCVVRREIVALEDDVSRAMQTVDRGFGPRLGDVARCDVSTLLEDMLDAARGEVFENSVIGERRRDDRSSARGELGGGERGVDLFPDGERRGGGVGER